MDDANAPGLLSMPYLGCSNIEDALYRQTREFVLSDENPYFFRRQGGGGRGRAARGVEYGVADGDHVPGADFK